MGQARPIYPSLSKVSGSSATDFSKVRISPKSLFAYHQQKLRIEPNRLSLHLCFFTQLFLGCTTTSCRTLQALRKGLPYQENHKAISWSYFASMRSCASNWQHSTGWTLSRHCLSDEMQCNNTSVLMTILSNVAQMSQKKPTFYGSPGQIQLWEGKTQELGKNR